MVLKIQSFVSHDTGFRTVSDEQVSLLKSLAKTRLRIVPNQTSQVALPKKAANSTPICDTPDQRQKPFFLKLPSCPISASVIKTSSDPKRREPNISTFDYLSTQNVVLAPSHILSNWQGQ